MILLLAPEHGPPATHFKRVADLHSIKNPVVRELEPRAGMRRFEISGGKTAELPSAEPDPCHTSGQPLSRAARSKASRQRGGSRKI